MVYALSFLRKSALSFRAKFMDMLPVLPNFMVAKDPIQFRNKINSISSQYHFFGLDFGFEESYNALLSCCVDDKNKILYIYDEVYMNHITDDRFSQREDVRRVAERAGRCENLYVQIVQNLKQFSSIDSKVSICMELKSILEVDCRTQRR